MVKSGHRNDTGRLIRLNIGIFDGLNFSCISQDGVLAIGSEKDKLIGSNFDCQCKLFILKALMDVGLFLLNFADVGILKVEYKIPIDHDLGLCTVSIIFDGLV